MKASRSQTHTVARVHTPNRFNYSLHTHIIPNKRRVPRVHTRNQMNYTYTIYTHYTKQTTCTEGTCAKPNELYIHSIHTLYQTNDGRKVNTKELIII